MHDLTPMTTMGLSTGLAATIGTITIVEIPDLELASLASRRGQEKACAADLAVLLGVPAPFPGWSVQADPISAIWMAPDQWLLAAATETHDDLAATLSSTFETRASITEQSGAWVCFDVSGDTVVDMCERLCPAPVRRMRTGEARRTTLHHMSCFLVCLNSRPTFRILGPRSSAGSLFHALSTAATSVA